MHEYLQNLLVDRAATPMTRHEDPGDCSRDYSYRHGTPGFKFTHPYNSVSIANEYYVD